MLDRPANRGEFQNEERDKKIGEPKGKEQEKFETGWGICRNEGRRFYTLPTKFNGDNGDPFRTE